LYPNPDKLENPKSEARNPKQIQMTEIQHSKKGQLPDKIDGLVKNSGMAK
jgi:hypothetical protein